jgi:hypothetical protein
MDYSGKYVVSFNEPYREILKHTSRLLHMMA